MAPLHCCTCLFQRYTCILSTQLSGLRSSNCHTFLSWPCARQNGKAFHHAWARWHTGKTRPGFSLTRPRAWEVCPGDNTLSRHSQGGIIFLCYLALHWHQYSSGPTSSGDHSLIIKVVSDDIFESNVICSMLCTFLRMHDGCHTYSTVVWWVDCARLPRPWVYSYSRYNTNRVLWDGNRKQQISSNRLQPPPEFGRATSHKSVAEVLSRKFIHACMRKWMYQKRQKTWRSLFIISSGGAHSFWLWYYTLYYIDIYILYYIILYIQLRESQTATNNFLLHAAVHSGLQGTVGRLNADWLLRYVTQEVNADWLLRYVTQEVNADWLSSRDCRCSSNI